MRAHRGSRWIVLSAAIPLMLTANAQEKATEGNRLAHTPRTVARIDLTGFWVSVVTQDWAYRMVTPAKGDRGSVPLNSEGSKMADAWDPAKDILENERCNAYGAPGVMRRPGRLHIYWENDSTLRVDLDAGIQTRRFHFADFLPPTGFETSEVPISLLRFQAPSGAATRQGYSIAAWQKVAQTRSLQPAQIPDKGGALVVMTTRMAPGYLQKNGIPYSADAFLVEYFDRIRLPDGADYLILTSVIDDSTYLSEPFVTVTEFKHEGDDSRWTPMPCDPN